MERDKEGIAIAIEICVPIKAFDMHRVCALGNDSSNAWINLKALKSALTPLIRTVDIASPLALIYINGRA